MEHGSSKRRRLACRGLIALWVVPALCGCEAFRLQDPDVIYIAFGDSATRGPNDLDYPDALRALLGAARSAFANEGDGGDTITAAVERLRDLLATDVYPNAEVLLLWEGGGDIIDLIGEIDPFVVWSVEDADYPYGAELEGALDRVRDDLEEAVALARADGLQVYLATYFPILGGFSACGAVPLNILLPGQAQRANEYLVLLNQHIRQAATASGATLVDIAAGLPDLAGDRDNYHDCNHLSETGNEAVATVFYEALRDHRAAKRR